MSNMFDKVCVCVNEYIYVHEVVDKFERKREKTKSNKTYVLNQKAENETQR